MKHFNELALIFCYNIDVIIKDLHDSEVDFWLIGRVALIFQTKLIIALNFGLIQTDNSVISEGLHKKICQFDLLGLFGIEQRVNEGEHFVMSFFR